MNNSIKSLSIFFLISLIVMHIFLIMYIYVFGDGSGQVPFSKISINLVFFFGIVSGLFSIFSLYRTIVKNSNGPVKVLIINTVLSLMVIPQVFMISLIYFFEMN